MTAYKLLRLRKDQTLGPLFINQRLRIPIGEWLEAECHPTKGYALRPGFHCTLQPVAPHLKEEGRVWCKVDIDDFSYFERPANQGSLWALANRMRVVEVLKQSTT